MKEQLSPIPGIEQKINEYVELIKAGGNKEFILQGLAPSWIARVEDKLGPQVEIGSQEKIEEPMSAQVLENIPDPDLLLKQKEEKLAKEQEEIDALRQQLGAIPKTVEFEDLENQNSSDATEQVEQEPSMQEKIKKVMDDHARLGMEIETFLDGMQQRFKESEDATFAPRYQNALADDFEKLKTAMTIEDVSKGYEEIAKTIGAMEHLMEYGAMYTNDQSGEIKDLETMEDALGEFTQELMKVTKELSVEFEKTNTNEVQFLNYTERILKDKLQKLRDVLDDKKSRLER